MLTIRLIESNLHEDLIQAKSVQLLSLSDGFALNVISGENTAQQLFNEGIAYVMNESGKTVATYNLDILNGKGEKANSRRPARPAPKT